MTPPNHRIPPGQGANPGANRAPYYGHGRLWTVLNPGGVRERPRRDGSIEEKFPWWRAVRGALRITGRRLDGRAPTLGARIPDGYGPTGFQASRIIFPTEGCWRVTATAGAASLSFVTLVVKAGGRTDPWRKLHRPLGLPQLAAGDACPVSSIDRRVDWKSVNIFGGSGIGRGPVYPGLGSSGGHLATMRRASDGPWFGGKLFWYVKPGYRGRVLIRGHRLDGPGWLRFNGGRRSRELRIGRDQTVSWAGQPPGSRGVPSIVRIRASGCYGVQVDGASLSRTVVFTASTP
ncbi:MAG: hypothetical protein ACR2LK_03410 [Solirubrobacteraceae bacterium]